MTRPDEQTFLYRLRRVRITRSGCWADAEWLCVLAADVVDTAADTVSGGLRLLGGRCYRNARAARDAGRGSS